MEYQQQEEHSGLSLLEDALLGALAGGAFGAAYGARKAYKLYSDPKFRIKYVKKLLKENPNEREFLRKQVSKFFDRYIKSGKGGNVKELMRQAHHEVSRRYFKSLMVWETIGYIPTAALVGAGLNVLGHLGDRLADQQPE